MNELFELPSSDTREPLAARMRPRTIEEFVGQEHIVGSGRLLRRAIEADQISSIIFYGPPGTGKTTLAQVIAGSTKSRFVSLNAVLSGVADIRKEINRAKDLRALQNRRTILFVDEVHRWNKSQQDALLPWVENGTVILIGATTENPYFEVNKALVSRSRVFQLTQLNESHLTQIAKMALLDTERGYGQCLVNFEPGALEHLVHVSSGDARSLLNALQLAVETTAKTFPPPKGTEIFVSMNVAEESIQHKAVLYDKEGDYHFDTISAFIKSVRGSDPDAALYWMALMLQAGESPRFLFRRMLISACEDIGLADPHAITVVQSCATAFDYVGLPEGQFHLTHACLYLATAPKSNSSLGYFDALKTVKEEISQGVPNHLRDGNRDKQAFGHGEGYQYPHAWREHWNAQQYLPTGLAGRVFYKPGELGYEGNIRNVVLTRRQAQIAAMLDEEHGSFNDSKEQVLTYSPGDDERQRWVHRTEIGQESLALRIRQILFDEWTVLRHQRVLIPSDSNGVLLWEANRRVPEGGVTVLCSSMVSYDALNWLAGGLPAIERPLILQGSLNSSKTIKWFSEHEPRFDVVLSRNWLARCSHRSDRLNLLRNLASLTEKKGQLIMAEGKLCAGTCISELIPEGHLDDERELFQRVEADFLSSITSGISTEDIKNLFDESLWKVLLVEEREVQETRHLSSEILDRWFFSEHVGSYGHNMGMVLGEEKWSRIAEKIKVLLKGRNVSWTSQFILVKAQRLV